MPNFQESVLYPKKKRILMILQSEYPPDIRISKEMKALVNNGYKIYLFSNNKSGLQKKEKSMGAILLRLKYFTILPQKINLLINTPLFFNPVWLSMIMKIVLKYKINIIHVHDLPLAMAGIIASRIFNIPVIFDVHENYPAALKIWGKKGFFPFLFRNPKIAEFLEKLSLKYADKIIVVSKEHKDLLTLRGFDHNKIVIVGNTVDHHYYLNIKIDRNIVEQYKKFYTVIYVGNLSPERDLETAIKSIKFINKTIPHLLMVIVGKGYIQSDLIKLVHNEQVGKNVQFVGWIDFQLTASYIQASKICMIPQPSNDLIDHGVPHKLFQYMVLGKPVIVSDSKAMSKIVNDSQCGEIFKSHSPEDFAKAVLKIYKSKKEYGINGIKAVKSKYNWGNSSKVLIQLYNELQTQ